MALSIVYCNSFFERTGGSNRRKFLPYHPTVGFTNPNGFEQGQYVSGFHSGFGWQLVNTAFAEMNYHCPLNGPHPIVVFRMYFRRRQVGFVDRDTFLRFESGAGGIGIVLRVRTGGVLEVMKNGRGDNAQTTATSLGVTSEPLPAATWVNLEVKVSQNLVQVWQNNTLTGSFPTTANAPMDRVTLRGEYLAVGDMMFSHVVIASATDASAERIGACVVLGHVLASDRAIADWTPNAPGAHYTRLVDSAPFGSRPDDDTTYLAGPGGDELFGGVEQNCFGRIRAVAVNIAAKSDSASTIQPRVAFDGASEAQDFGAPIAPYFDRYNVQQSITMLNPSGEVWTHDQLFESAFGFRASGAPLRVSSLYVERVVDISGLSFDCGGGMSSYIL